MNFRFFCSVTLWGAFLLVFGCLGEIDENPVADDDTGDDDTAGDDDTGDDDSESPLVEIGDWEPCPLVPGVDSDGAECADASLPLDYSNPGGDRLQMLVKRLPGSGGSQLWLLHGGPGASAVDELDGMAYSVPEERPDITIYAIDHRGIGGSGRLGCPEQESPQSEDGESISGAEWPGCIEAIEEEWGENLDQLTTSNSARDLGALIDHLAGGEEVFVYGGSYGTYLAIRYLQLFPDQPDGVIIDGISAPGTGFMHYDLGFNTTANALMDLCAADPSCAGHFQEHPWVVAGALIDAFDEGHCPALGTDGDFIRYFLGSLLFYDKVRDIVPAVVHRLDRCDEDDVDAIVNLYYTYMGLWGMVPHRPPVLGEQPGKEGNEGTGYSNALFYHIATSEMWDPAIGPAHATAMAEWETYVMSTGLTTWVASMAAVWPAFPQDEFNGGYPEYDGPLLMLQGGLDPATPGEQAQAVGEHLMGPNQTWAYIPQAAHGAIAGTGLPWGGNCGLELYLQFLEEPTANVDLGCIEDTLPVQFDGYDEWNAYLLGTEDAWGD